MNLSFFGIPVNGNFGDLNEVRVINPAIRGLEFNPALRDCSGRHAEA